MSAIQKTVTKSGLRLLTQGKYCDENIEVKIDNADNLVPINVAEGIEIGGVTGTLHRPTGTIEITNNISRLDVSNYQYASVSVGANATVLSVKSHFNEDLDIHITKAKTDIVSAGILFIS